MAGYILKRLLRSVLSLIIVVFIIMLLVFQLMNRDQIFKGTNLQKYKYNAKEVYKYETFEEYGYLDYVNYTEYATAYTKETGETAPELPKKMTSDDDIALIKQFKDEYEGKGYTIVRADARNKQDIAVLFAYKDRNIFERLWDFFSHILVFDTTSYAEVTPEYVEKYGELERKIYFADDPLNGSWCIMGSGTKHKYLFYFDDIFPFVHQNFVKINLGKKYFSNQDFFEYFTENQGEVVKKEMTYADGSTAEVGYDYHKRTFNVKTSEDDYKLLGDTYTSVSSTYTNGLSMIGYSFIIGIISTILVYILGVPLGLLLALKKDRIADKIGNLYIIFIMAVPSLAYIYLFAMIGSNLFGLPDNWPTGTVPLVYILPIVSLALPSIASLMKWTRRYMIDQMTSDYVKFARSQGFSEGEIFRKHILKNALIPIVQGIPGSILGALTGAIITERVYNVPGMGKLLTSAINTCDNSVIIGISFFYALLSVASLILGDVLMTKVDPRISFSGGGGRK